MNPIDGAFAFGILTGFGIATAVYCFACRCIWRSFNEALEEYKARQGKGK